MASGKPVSPSTQAMKRSFTPRFCSSVKTENQNLASSVCAIHIPRSSFCPSISTPSTREMDFLITRWFSRTFFRLDHVHKLLYTLPLQSFFLLHVPLLLPLKMEMA